MKEIKKIVKQGYTAIAQGSGCCSCKSTKVASEIGYAKEDMEMLADANLGLGCGNPTAIGEIKEGDVVLDLGSGAGFDVFIAARKVGVSGKVIGVDMTPEMIAKARENALKLGVENVEFVLGEIEALPVESGVIDIIISNCVINLSPDKDKVFQEAYRALKRGGSLFVSDIVLLSDLTEEQKNDDRLLTGCVAGALLKDDYLEKVRNAGFVVEIKKENKEISKQQYDGIDLESISIKATK
jgi:arsenite methyltransferase